MTPHRMTLKRLLNSDIVSPQDHEKLMTLPPAQRLAHIRFALGIWISDQLKDPTCTLSEQLRLLDEFKRLFKK